METSPAHGAAGAARSDLLTVESCTTTWAFDTARKRFARLPRGLALSNTSAEWRPYESVAVDVEHATLEVTLDAGRRQLLRSDIHTGGTCPSCGATMGATEPA